MNNEDKKFLGDGGTNREVAEKIVVAHSQKHGAPVATTELIESIEAALTTAKADLARKFVEAVRPIVAEDKAEYEAEQGTGFIGLSYEYAGSRECLEAVESVAIAEGIEIE